MSLACADLGVGKCQISAVKKTATHWPFGGGGQKHVNLGLVNQHPSSHCCGSGSGIIVVDPAKNERTDK